MPKNTSSRFSLFFKCLLFCASIIYGCASMRSPEGGPRDTTPPKVLKMEPKDLTTNFKSEKVIITFDEYFNLKDEFKEFNISPEQEKPPLLKKNKKRLEIVFQDSLEKNTTYTLNFGKSIADVNENNVLKNLTYAFSTGPLLDSLSISGRVINSLTDKPELDAVVFILPLAQDSLFGKKRPSIYTTTDSSGRYKLSNLRKGTYKIYALKETGGDKIYQQSTDEIGFQKAPIELTKNIDNINLNIFKESATNFRILDRKFNPDGSIFIAFNQSLIKPELLILDQPIIDEHKIVRFNKGNDSVKVWLQDLSFDSVKIAIKSDRKALDTLVFNRDKKDTYTRSLLLSDNLAGDVLNPYRALKVYSNFPVEKIDLSKITLLEDTVPKTNFTLVKDSTDFLAYQFNYPWKKKVNYRIKFAEGAVIGIFKTPNKEINKSLKLGSTDDYGTLTLNVQLPNDSAKNYLLQILNERKQVITTEIITKNRAIVFSNYSAGIYFARIVYDDNKNGVWDTGNVSKQTQPETIWNSPAELSIKANWDRNEILAIPPKP